MLQFVFYYQFFIRSFHEKIFFYFRLGLTTACYAADSPAKAPCDAAGFSGFYAGVSTGYGFGKASHYAPKGAFGGVFVGGGFTTFSKLYLGAEVGYARCAMKQYRRPNPFADLMKFRIKDHLEAAARIGYEGKTVLPYVKLGYAWSTVAITNQTNWRKFFDGTMSGFTWGLGLDARVNQTVSAGIGYTCAKLKNKKKGRFNKLTNQSVLVRLAYHF